MKLSKAVNRDRKKYKTANASLVDLKNIEKKNKDKMRDTDIKRARAEKEKLIDS